MPLLHPNIAPLALVAVLLACGCRDSNMVSSSMFPTIKPGEKVSVDYTAYLAGAPQRWDVVTFKPPMMTGQVWVMRVVAVPGETVAFARGGIALNGRPLVLPPKLTNVTYVSLDDPALRFAAGGSNASPYVVPTNSYFVFGDNSKNANDSRFWGAIPRTNILGRVRNK